jgi:hypothetical protein
MTPSRQYFVSPPHSPQPGRNRYSTRGSTSGPDGYEAFENTNNKKKRKIPTSGSLSLHQSAMTDQIAHVGPGGTKDGAADDAYYASVHANSGSGLGVQGAGRGRGARKTSGRNPLGVSVNGSNARSVSSKYDQNMSANAKGEINRSGGCMKNSDCFRRRRVQGSGYHICCNSQCHGSATETAEQRARKYRGPGPGGETGPQQFSIHLYLRD